MRRLLGALVRLVQVVAVLLVVVLAVTATRVVLAARSDERRASDVLVVLGAAQFDGDPGPVLRSRLEHALELYQEGVAPVVVTTGGALAGDRFTEGGSGKAWLVEQGVPADAVVAVEEGGDTLSSLQATAEVMDERGWRSAVVVTDGPHELRSEAMLDDLGVDAVRSPAPREIGAWTTVRYVVRESVAYLYYQVHRVLG